MKNKKWETVGTIGVDAGLCWIGDPCYIIHPDKRPKDLGKTWGEFVDKLSDCSNSRQFNYDAGHPGLGVTVDTGYGDGEYPVEVRRSKDGLIAEVRVVFINEKE